MNRNLKLLVSVLGVLAVLLLGTLAISQAVQAKPNGPTGNIFGSWNVAVTTVGQGTQFPALLTFTSDGAVLTDEPPGPGETTGHGNWIRGKDGAVDFTFVSLFGDPTTGAYAGRLKVAGTLNRDNKANTWSGPFKITLYDASDQQSLTDTGTFKLTWIAVEPLD